MPKQFKCRQCNGILLFPASTEKRTCTECGTVTHLSEALEQEEEEEKVRQEEGELYRSEDTTDPDKTQAPGDSQALAEAFRQAPAGARRRQQRKGQEDVDYLELLAQLMQLALAVCNADLLDCVAVVRNFQASEQTALRCLAGKVCHELAVLNREDHDPVVQKGSCGSSSSSTRTGTRVEQIVAAFLAERLQTDKLGKNTGKSRRNSIASSSLLDPRSLCDPTASMSSCKLKRSGTSNTEISLTSYSDFAKENRTFTLKGDASQADSSTARGQALVGKSRRASCASSKPMFRRGSVESKASAYTSMSRTTQVSTMIRSLLRGQADKSKSENIGDLTWGMDGVPHDESDQHVQQTKALISRYGGERRPQQAATKSSLSPLGDDAPEIPLNKGSLMTFVVRGAQLAAVEQDLRSCHGSYEESVTTSVLLDHALAGMDLGGAHPRHQKQEQCRSSTLRRALSKESCFSGASRMKRATSGESCSTILPSEHELGSVADGHWQRKNRPGTRSGAFSNPTRDHLCLIEEASAASSCKASRASEKKEEAERCCSPAAQDTEEADEEQLTAKEKWLRRKEAKKKKRNENGRTTYGAIVRNGYEQFLSGPVAEKGDALAASEKPAELDHASSSLRMLDAAVESAKGIAAARAVNTSTSAEHSSAGAHSPTNTHGVAEVPSQDEARARWEQRRAEKRAARKASSKTTYGQLVRLEHEQMLSTEGAASAPSTSTAKPTMKKQVLSSVRFRTHDGSLSSSPSSSTTCEGVSRARCDESDPVASVRDAHIDPGQDLPGTVILGAQRLRRQNSGEMGTRSQGCHSILKDKLACVEEGRRPRAAARSVEFNLKQNLVYDLQDTRD